MRRILFLAAFCVVGLLTALQGCGTSNSSTFTVNTSLKATARAQARGCDRVPCTGSPESMSIKLYQAYISTNADCSSPILVTDHGTAGASIALGTDALIQASPTAGSYQCLILVMSDNLSFKPDATAVAAFTPICATGVTSIFDIYRAGGSDSNLWKDLNGSAITATGATLAPGDDKVTIFASTNSAAVTGGALAPHANQLVTLTSALTVPGQTTFYVDFSNGIASISGECKVEGGTGMGFR